MWLCMRSLMRIKVRIEVTTFCLFKNCGLERLEQQEMI